MKELIGEWSLVSAEDEHLEGDIMISHISEDSFNGSCVQRLVAAPGVCAQNISGSIYQKNITFTTEYFSHKKIRSLITYTGVFSESKQSFSGTWEIKESPRQVGQAWLEVITEGTWEMRRK